MSYNPDHLKIYQDRYRIGIAYFVLFQIFLISVQVLLSIPLLQERSDAVYAIFFTGCAKSLPVNAKPCCFAFCCVKWHIWWVSVSLRGDITHLYWCFMLCWRKFWNVAFVQLFVCAVRMCYFLRFFNFGPSDKIKKHCQRQSGPRVKFSLPKLLG